MRVDEKLIEVPMASGIVPGYVPRYISPGGALRLSAAQGEALKRLTVGLQMAGARKANGKPITDKQDSILWLLDRLSDAEVTAETQHPPSQFAAMAGSMRDLPNPAP